MCVTSYLNSSLCSNENLFPRALEVTEYLMPTALVSTGITSLIYSLVLIETTQQRHIMSSGLSMAVMGNRDIAE